MMEIGGIYKKYPHEDKKRKYCENYGKNMFLYYYKGGSNLNSPIPRNPSPKITRMLRYYRHMVNKHFKNV